MSIPSILKLKNSSFLVLIILGLGSGLVQCSTAGQRSVYSVDGEWSASMQGMSKSLDKLLPFIFSSEEYRDPKNRQTIQGLIGDFEKLATQVPSHIGEELLGKDPIIRYAVGGLRSNALHAKNSFAEGQIEYSRNVLRENVGLCFSCHSTQKFGPQTNSAAIDLPSAFRVSTNERAEYYVATRQFDRALSTLDSVIKSPTALLERPQEQLAALRKYLFLQVRIKNDPAPAIALLDKYLAWKGLPYFLSQDVKVWRDSLAAWQKEQKSPQASIQFAQQLAKKARAHQLSSYQGGLIDYLRASMVLHEGLRRANTPQTNAQIYGLLGESYETLADMGVWDLPEVYYEACIRVSPKSAEAKSCYRRYERSIILGFSGSGGIFIPQDERSRMEELRKLSGLKIGDLERREDTVDPE